MKYIVLVPDGMADEPVAELGGKTPLEAAHTPNMDLLAQGGVSGLVKTIPDGFLPGSDIGNLALMGYDPNVCFTGRSPLEAANMGIILADDEIAFRCNLATVHDGKMVDYSAGHITTEEARELIAYLQEKLNHQSLRFYAGKSYRHIMVLKTNEQENYKAVKTIPPHDILNQSIEQYLPQGNNVALLLDLMARSVAILKEHPVNQARLNNGLAPATMIWLWGQGGKPRLPLFRDRYGLTGSVISAVDLVNGIGRLAGLDVIDVPGANGYYDTNYAGKAEYALASLKNKDFVYIHIEAPDEAGHNGDWKAKKESIEKIDAIVVSKIIEYAKNQGDVRILVSPDHPTPINKRTHTRLPVPFILYGEGVVPNGISQYSESQAAPAGVLFDSGEKLLAAFFKRGVK